MTRTKLLSVLLFSNVHVLILFMYSCHGPATNNVKLAVQSFSQNTANTLHILKLDYRLRFHREAARCFAFKSLKLIENNILQ